MKNSQEAAEGANLEGTIASLVLETGESKPAS